MVLAAREDAMEDVAGAVACMVPKGKNSKKDSSFYALLSLLLRTYYAELSAIAKNDVWGGSRLLISGCRQIKTPASMLLKTGAFKRVRRRK